MVRHHRAIYTDPSIGGDDPGSEFDRHLESVRPERVEVAEEESEVAGWWPWW